MTSDELLIQVNMISLKYDLKASFWEKRTPLVFVEMIAPISQL